jgi:hypothetical protein
MPVTIQEMNVTTNVQSNDKNNAAKSNTNGGKGGGVDTELIIRECIQRVLKEMERRKTR